METAGTSVAVTDMPSEAPAVDRERCSGCGRCVAACSKRKFTLETVGHRKQAVINGEKECDLCGKCVQECRIGAVRL